ncbi:MAG: hypothetical protein UW46_C0004G0002 [Candidatus Yanofskybacteria bacterium GW2011_GWF1_44_227]|uniref:Septum formation initiator n=1 Tax=Candidatus Yanofskybacteria bacterium GW2011_GWE2_40_11 TaxID=1619033 RepID=A0A0G0QKD2_9BACT|nr:MAG: hypothetical protein UT69_C0015G0009 [Candidatus Yanofskybacteria bacterium GW2011_GWE1_40_10]KKR40879.1 MAG: hypothetical protein UT75_C0003G0009 [Candidatus Yanofskybacteria bacterium GW2011_GWE2_40_11]KKT53275.1 MAG: hypothetical protein UW46_C0004G0002 [Candidatus Yanofskybacteria bacterium GW2011_GWF1_44_227]OGN35423.1 MAG: hypothetical protein A2207_00325 [Candidatus Yanofskybacteria bacterium RIFOXYA1_FULL_44_17]OGN36488.1 MAG: hypothetical protein A2241_01980 [Candidatus Yanofsk
MIQKVFKSKYFTVVVVLLLFWAAYLIIGASMRRSDVEDKIVDLENKASEIEKSNKYLERIMTYIKTPAFLEREARIKLNYKSADENVAFIYMNNESKDRVDDVQSIAAMSNPQRWWNWLMGR